jgi:tRNA A-37 threonylcarbamoyl transferase component Bud32
MNTLSNTPAKIGRYPVLRLLGRGAMGSVYLARDTELDRDVAIKTVRLPQALSEQESFLVRFRNEARAVGRLRHRSIVSVYDVGNDAESGPFLVFEYIEGANLKDILRSRGPLPPREVVALAEQVGGALSAAHREGIIHRDIKPENLLVDRDQVVHLADFGVARVPDAALTGEGQFLGTPCYGAPETLRGREAGPLSDQFSFAAVLYEAASGKRAFPGSDAVAVAHAVIHDEPKPPGKVVEPPARVPGPVDEVIVRALSKAPEARFGSVLELVSELRAAYARAGLVQLGDPLETVPALLASPRAQRKSDPAREARKLPLWPIAVLLGAGGVALWQLMPSGEIEAGSDAGEGASRVVAVLARDAALALPTPTPADADAAGASVDADAAALALLDAGTEAAAPVLSSFEREERAKDALERAEKALSNGDRAAAEAALNEAFQYDPEHPDIAALRRRL